MKTILICIECMGHDFLMKVKPKNIMGLNPHLAFSLGGMTRASVPLLLGGLLPVCQECNYHNNEIRKKLINPFFLTDLKRKTNLLLYIPNGWVLELFSNFMPKWLLDLCKKQNEQGFDTKEFIDKFLDMNLNDYFVYVHIQETHPPFFNGVDTSLIGRLGFENAREKALLYVDNIIKPLLDLPADIIITSDHDLKYGHWNIDMFKVFLATRCFKK